MEKVLWVDENDNVLGEVERGKAHREGILHRIAVIYLTRPDGTILIQERVSGRLDHSAAGHVDIGESYLDAAKRELKEELGVDVDLVKVGKTISDEVEYGTKNHIRHIFEVFKCEAEPVVLAESEVKSVFWDYPRKILEEMKNDVDNNKYTGGFKASLKLFLEKI